MMQCKINGPMEQNRDLKEQSMCMCVLLISDKVASQISVPICER